MSILADAFQHTLDARERVVGVRERINVNGIDYDSLVETISLSPEAIAGGYGESGTFLCQIAIPAFVVPPDIGMPVIVRGRALQILEIQNINQLVYGLVVGDASYE